MSTQDLIKYIEEARSRGVSDNAIRTTLLYAHWTKEEIGAAFKGYDESRLPFDPATVSGVGKTRAVNFTNKGRAVAPTLERGSRRLLIFVVVLIIVVAVAAAVYVIEQNGVLIPVRAVPQ